MESPDYQENHENGENPTGKEFISLKSTEKVKCTVGYVYCKELIQHCNKIPNLKGRVRIHLHHFSLIIITQYFFLTRHL